MSHTLNTRLMVNSSGFVTFVREISSTIRCQMYLQEYPLDIQNCPVIVESFKYDLKQVHLHWIENGHGNVNHLSGTEMPMTVSQEVELDSWNLIDIIMSNCSHTLDPDPRSCLKMEFRLERKSGFFIFHASIFKI